MQITTRVCDLTDDQKDDFIEAFYNELDCDLHDCESPIPWGCPWFYCNEKVLTGSTVEEMAINYCLEVLCEIKSEFISY